MLTSFGKTLRKIRIDHSVTLGQLGELTGVSAAFISALERGKPVPKDFIAKISSTLKLAPHDELALEQAAAQQIKEVTLKIDGMSDSARELVVAFARRFEDLSDDEVRSMLGSLQRQ
ncbi:MAG: XRE family transcriptional regulator [Gammaproteobacteria bacterium HGW-Gammaproteobacteria-4]|nr:MAG: XRE family transcriptional regulator [Gammaproteobacteria bacterium HGW-Gammaproteobacteria-4]